MKEIMTSAWSIAKYQARVKGGKASEYISYGLTKAWECHKYQQQMRNKFIASYIERFNSRKEMAIALLTETDDGSYRELHDEEHIDEILRNFARWLGIAK